MSDLEKKQRSRETVQDVSLEKGEKEQTKTDEFDIYGEQQETAQIKYRTLVWWKAAALMLAETVSLGILSLPSAFAALGMVAGCFMVLGLGTIATATGYFIGAFKLRYPHVHNMADAGEILAGPIGREVLGAAQIIFTVCACSSHVLAGLIAFDTMSNGASCSVMWAGVTAIVSVILTMPRTLNGISWLSVVSFISIIASVLITMIGVGVAGHVAPISASSHLSFANGFLAVTDIIFAYAGHAAFFTFISEMETPTDFPKALFALQCSDTALYLICGVVVYAFVGDNAVSPALGNTGPTLRKIAYGIALPTILIAGVVNGHVAAKLIFVRVFRRHGKTSKHMTANTWTGWLSWIGICFGVWLAAFILAELIPFFNDLLGIVAALFASWYTYGISGIFYFHMTPTSERWTTKWQKAKSTFFVFIIVMAAFIMVAGLYGSITSIINGYRSGAYGVPFSCVSHALAD